jgi:hypothetical protein
VFFNRFDFKSETLKKMDSVSGLKCVKINDQKQLFLGFCDGKIIQFDPVKKHFEKEFFFKNHSILCIAHINSYEGYLTQRSEESSFFYHQKNHDIKNEVKKEYLLSICEDEFSEKKIILWDMLTSCEKKAFSIHNNEILSFQVLRDNYTFYTIFPNKISFYEISKQGPIWEQNFIDENITGNHLSNDLSLLIVITTKQIYFFDIIYAFNPFYSKIGFRSLSLKQNFLLEGKVFAVNEICFPNKHFLLLEKSKMVFLDYENFRQNFYLDLDYDYRDFRVLENPIEQKTYLILLGYGIIKIFDFESKKIVKELDVFQTEELDKEIAKISNIVFWNFNKSLKVLFLDESSKKENSVLYEFVLS